MPRSSWHMSPELSAAGNIIIPIVNWEAGTWPHSVTCPGSHTGKGSRTLCSLSLESLGCPLIGSRSSPFHCWPHVPVNFFSQRHFHRCVLSCFTHVWLCDPVDCSPPGPSVHGILQARILEWVSVPSSRGSSQTRDGTHVSCTGRRILHHCPPGKPLAFR